MKKENDGNVDDEEDTQTHANQLPDHSPKKSMASVVATKHKTWTPFSFKQDSSFKERSKTHVIFNGCPPRIIFQQNLTPIIITRNINITRELYCLDNIPSKKKSHNDLIGSLVSSLELSGERVNYSGEQFGQSKTSTREQMQASSIEIH